MEDVHKEYNTDLSDFLKAHNVTSLAGDTYQGLSEKEALIRQRQRPNVIPSRNHIPLRKQIEEIIREPINVLLIAASIALAIIYLISREEKEHLTVCVFTFIIMSFNIALEIYHQNNLRKFVEESTQTAKCKVYRDGELRSVDKKNIVIGDILKLSAGDEIGADCRIIRAENLWVNTSTISGNLSPVSKGTDSGDNEYKDAENMVFESNMVVSGTATAIVIEVGRSTILGQINERNLDGKKGKSALYRDIDVFFYGSFLLATATCLIFMVSGIFLKITPIQIAAVVVSTYISFLPEGIPTLVKLLLYTAAMKLKKRGAWVPDMDALQTLGEVTIICIEKNALVNEGALMCEMIFDGEKMRDVELTFEEKNVHDLEYLKAIGEICTVISYNMKHKDENDQLSIIDQLHSTNLPLNASAETPSSNPIHCDFRLKNPVEALNGSVSDTRNLASRRDADKRIQNDNRFLDSDRQSLLLFGKICQEYFNHSIDFDSKIQEFKTGNTYTVLVDKGKYNVLYAVGNPEELLHICRFKIRKGMMQRLNNTRKNKMIRFFNDFQKHGYRLVALARVSVSKRTDNFNRKNFTFLSYLCLKDIVKIDAPLTLNLLSAAGILVCITNNGGVNALRTVGNDLFDEDNYHEDNDTETENRVDVSGINKGKNRGLRSMVGTPGSPTNRLDLTDNILNRGGNSEDDVNKINNKNVQSFDAFGDQFENHSRDKSLCKKILVHNADSKQKTQMVERLQRDGHVVAYFGAREDDCQAMMKADVAICLASAPLICKEVGSIILPALQIEGIVYGIEEGRLFYVNLQKAIRYVMMHIAPQVFAFIIFVFLGTPLPISPILLIFLNYLVEIFPAIFLAYENPEYNLITNGPKSAYANTTDFHVEVPQEQNTWSVRVNGYIKRFRKIIDSDGLYSSYILRGSIVEAGLITSIGCLLSFFIALSSCGIPLSQCFFVSHKYFRYNAPALILSSGVEIDSEHQLYILYRSQCTYFVGLMICQFCNLLICRRTFGFITTNFFNNPTPLICSICGISITCFFIYLPFFESFLLVRKPVLKALIAPACAGLLIILFDTTKKLKAQLYK